MKNYELISILDKLQAGAEVKFCSSVPAENVGNKEEGYRQVESDINDADENCGVIYLMG